MSTLKKSILCIGTFVLIFASFVASSSVGFSATDLELKASCVSDPNRLWFFGKCWCEQGWVTSPSANPALPNCSVPLLQIGDCDCFPDRPNNRTFLKDMTWFHPEGYRCTSLCRSNEFIGVPRSVPAEWHDNQIWKQLGFYKRELPQKRHNHLRGRLEEFANAYKHWRYLEGRNLGKVLELGCGPYTQTRNILEHVRVNMTEVTLVDPLMEHYLQISRVTYRRPGSLSINETDYPAVLHLMTIERFHDEVLLPQNLEGAFDTVILMNVIVYAQDAFKIMETMYRALKMGGLLIFHDRYFEDVVKNSRCKMSGFYTNVIEIPKFLLDHFINSGFSRKPFFFGNQTEEQKYRSANWCLWLDSEIGYFTVITKTQKVLL